MINFANILLFIFTIINFSFAEKTEDSLSTALDEHIKIYRTLKKDSAFKNFNSIYYKAKKHNYISLLIETSINLAWCSEFFYEIDSLFYYLKLSESYANKFNKHSYLKKIYFTKGLFYYKIRDYEKSIRFFSDLIEELNIYNINDSLYIHSSLSYLGDAYLNYDNVYQAQLAYENSLLWLKPFESNDNFTYEFYLAVALNKLGYFHYETKSFEESKAYYLNALDLIKSETKTYFNLYPSILLNLAKLHFDENNHELSEYYLYEATNSLNKYGNG